MISVLPLTKPVLVMIVSYETLRTLSTELANCEIGLLVCDEGHRLKNGDSLTFTTLTGLRVQRRVILSGTPIQNDLSEYFSLLNFANPNYLGSKAEFRKNFENAIIRGRDVDASDTIKEASEAKLKELGALVSPFIIRRTNELLSKYCEFIHNVHVASLTTTIVPVKYEQVVFCRLSPLQLALYRLFISSDEIRKLLRGKGSQPLKAIGLLKKLCNHPALLDLPEELPGSAELLPTDYTGGISAAKNFGGRERAQTVDCQHSGKFMVLER
jgi:DNA repair and recombination protein RAD54 and RAD54-like protein